MIFEHFKLSLIVCTVGIVMTVMPIINHLQDQFSSIEIENSIQCLATRRKSPELEVETNEEQ